VTKSNSLAPSLKAAHQPPTPKTYNTLTHKVLIPSSQGKDLVLPVLLSKITSEIIYILKMKVV